MRKLTDEDIDEIHRLRSEDGLQTEEIAKMFPVTGQRIRQLLSERPHRSAPWAKKWELKTYLEENPHLLQQEIADTLNMSSGYVCEVKKEFGIKANKTLQKWHKWVSSFDSEEEDSCWEWQKLRYPTGYGRFGQLYAHRVSWEIENGDIPEGLHILHTCDNPPCVNPKHLYVGTHQDNMRDRQERHPRFNK